MKKLIFSTTLTTFLIMLLIAPSVQAASVDNASDILKSVGESVFGSSESDIVVIIGGVIKVILGLVGVVFTILIIYGGALYMTAAGSQEQVSKARALLRDSVIGLAIIILSFSITHFVVIQLISEATG